MLAMGGKAETLKLLEKLKSRDLEKLTVRG